MAAAKKPKFQSDKYRDRFMDTFSEITSYIKKDVTTEDVGDAMKHLLECLEYTVPGGKLNRGLMVVGSLDHLTPMTPELEKDALILGWCVELLQACFLVADDIMDKSKTRRGKTCWYLKEGVGLVAINDSLWLESFIYEILRRSIKGKAYYFPIVELFQEVSYLTKVGQCLDTIVSPEDDIDLDRFTANKYAAIVKYKTAFYSFYLPVGIAMYMAGYNDAEIHSVAKDILLKMGEYFQIQDDYLDCYGDPEVTGKIGTDIEDNKCSWLVVQAIAKATPQQKALLEANYGRQEPQYVTRVKELYEELHLKDLYHDYEQRSYDELIGMIEAMESLPKSLFFEFCTRIFKRNK